MAILLKLLGSRLLRAIIIAALRQYVANTDNDADDKGLEEVLKAMGWD